MHIETITRIIAIAERATTPEHEARNALEKVFKAIRSDDISLSGLLQNIKTSRATLIQENHQLKTKQVALEAELAALRAHAARKAGASQAPAAKLAEIKYKLLNADFASLAAAMAAPKAKAPVHMTAKTSADRSEAAKKAWDTRRANGWVHPRSGAKKTARGHVVPMAPGSHIAQEPADQNSFDPTKPEVKAKPKATKASGSARKQAQPTQAAAKRAYQNPKNRVQSAPLPDDETEIKFQINVKTKDGSIYVKEVERHENKIRDMAYAYLDTEFEYFFDFTDQTASVRAQIKQWAAGTDRAGMVGDIRSWKKLRAVKNVTADIVVCGSRGNSIFLRQESDAIFFRLMFSLTPEKTQFWERKAEEERLAA